MGDATAAVLLAELFHQRYGSARQAAAFAGLVPRVWAAGTLHRRRRLSKRGAGRLRKQLYFPALTAARFIVGAVMRKLIHLAYGVLKSRRTVDPHGVSACLRNTVSSWLRG